MWVLPSEQQVREELRRVQRDLMQAERMAPLGSLVAGVARDFILTAVDVNRMVTTATTARVPIRPALDQTTFHRMSPRSADHGNHP